MSASYIRLESERDRLEVIDGRQEAPFFQFFDKMQQLHIKYLIVQTAERRHIKPGIIIFPT